MNVGVVCAQTYLQCLPPAPVALSWTGFRSHCAPSSDSPCRVEETVHFEAHPLLVQPCDRIEWDFGDGSPPPRENRPIIDHRYADAGKYVVTVRVWNEAGEQSAREVVYVDETCACTVVPIIEKFTASKNEVKLGEAVTITWTVRGANRVRIGALGINERVLPMQETKGGQLLVHSSIGEYRYTLIAEGDAAMSVSPDLIIKVTPKRKRRLAVRH